MTLLVSLTNFKEYYNIITSETFLAVSLCFNIYNLITVVKKVQKRMPVKTVVLCVVVVVCGVSMQCHATHFYAFSLMFFLCT
jgi:hypothetical protein